MNKITCGSPHKTRFRCRVAPNLSDRRNKGGVVGDGLFLFTAFTLYVWRSFYYPLHSTPVFCVRRVSSIIRLSIKRQRTEDPSRNDAHELSRAVVLNNVCCRRYSNRRQQYIRTRVSYMYTITTPIRTVHVSYRSRDTIVEEDAVVEALHMHSLDRGLC